MTRDRRGPSPSPQARATGESAKDRAGTGINESMLPAPPLPSTTAPAIVFYAPGGVSMPMPVFIAAAGEHAAHATLEFFTARIPNSHTRKAYGRAVSRFCEWCGATRVTLGALTAPTVSTYLAGLQESQDREGLSLASLKLTASAIRHWLDFLTERRVRAHNPARSVRTERLVVTEGKTPVFSRDEGRRLFASLDVAAATGHIAALRDRALFAIMRYGFVRIGASCACACAISKTRGSLPPSCCVRRAARNAYIACHHKAREYLRAYVVAAGFEARAKEPLFQTAKAWQAKLSGVAMTIDDALRAVKRRCKMAALPSSVCNHSFRATGITVHRENGGRLEDAQKLAGHADARTTRPYVRKARKLAQAEVERVQL